MWRNCIQRLKDMGGYTLLTMMLSISVLCFVASLITLISSATVHQSVKNNVGRKDIWLFLHQLDLELSNAKNTTCDQDKLEFMLDNNTVTYKRVNNRLRRLLNNTGNEIVLENFRSFECKTTTPQIEIIIIDKEGKKYRWSTLNMVE